AATVTFPGTVTGAVADNATSVALVTALLIVTVQLLVALLPIDDGLQDTPVSVAGELAVTVKVFDPPFNDAVSSEDWLDVMPRADALNVPLVAPVAMLMLAGTVIFEFALVNETVTPGEGAAPVRVTVQLAEPGALKGDGEQLSVLG